MSVVFVVSLFRFMVEMWMLLFDTLNKMLTWSFLLYLGRWLGV
jgi:hypothetical protein